MAHREKKGIVLARNSKVAPETKKRAKERSTETETRKLHYVMKLPCFIERYVCHTKGMSTHCCRTLIVRARFYLPSSLEKWRRTCKNPREPYKTLTELRSRLLTDTKSMLQIIDRTLRDALVYNEAWKLHTKINVLLRNGTRLMRLVKRYKLGLRELNYADELRIPILLRALENEFIFVILVGIRICWIKWHFAR